MNIRHFLIYNTYAIKIILLNLIAATLLYKVNFGNTAIIIAIAYNLLFFNKKNIYKFKSFAFVFPVVFLIITVFSSLISAKYMEGLRHTDLELLPLLLSVIIINTKVNTHTIQRIFTWFYSSSVISTTILLINFIIRFSEGFKVNDLIFHSFTSLYDQHPVYFSMFLSLALFYDIIIEKQNNNYRRLLFNSIILIGIILCASKAVLLFNIIGYSLYFFIKAKGIKKRVIYAFVVIVVSISVFNITFVKNRFLDGLRFSKDIVEFKPTNDVLQKKIFLLEEKTKISDLELRYIFWRIGIFHLIKDNKIVFGYGQGDVQNYLDYYYFSYNLAPNWCEGRNLHNQYLHILVTYGLFALFFFISYLSYSFYQAIKYKNVLYLFFLSLVSFVFIFEVVLVRNKGIVFFYFFNTLFLFNNIRFENSNYRNKRNT